MVLGFGMWEPDKLHCSISYDKGDLVLHSFQLVSPNRPLFFSLFFFLYETICSFFFLLENLVKPKRHSLLSSPPEKSFITGILLLRERNSFGNIPIEGSEVSPTTSHPKIAVTQGERGCPRSLVVGTV